MLGKEKVLRGINVDMWEGIVRMPLALADPALALDWVGSVESDRKLDGSIAFASERGVLVAEVVAVVAVGGRVGEGS